MHAALLSLALRSKRNVSFPQNNHDNNEEGREDKKRVVSRLYLRAASGSKLGKLCGIGVDRRVKEARLNLLKPRFVHLSSLVS